jgi:predicted AlkP superfamily pyrophosphatase or phosphodiesterase
MRRLLPLFFLFVSCVSSSLPEVTPARPALRATGTAQRVVLLSFDGLGADALARQTGLTSFEHLATHGASGRVIPVNPTVTSSTHTAILTGADPQRSGIVSNRYHSPGTPIDAIARGMITDIDVETLVEAARRQGKRVGAVPFPTIDTRNARRTADFGMVWTEPLTPSRLIRLSRADFRREWVPPTWTDRPQRRRSFSPVMRARIEWSVSKTTRTDVDVVAYDTTDDRVANYDTYLIEAGELEITPDAKGWFPISTRSADGLHGSWSKILPSRSLDLSIYWGSISRTNAYPESFRAILDEEAGFWPGIPDDRAPIDPQLYAEQLVRLADFHTRAQTATLRRMDFDLLLAYQPEMDQAMHKFMGVPEGELVVRAAFLAANRAVAEIGSRLDVSRDALIITADHGFVPTVRDVRLNRMLIEAGLAGRWRAYVSGSVAHLYRFSGPDDADSVVALLNASGLFERVEKKTAAMHRHSGDVIAYAQPDIDLTPSDEAPVVGAPTSRGHHGGLNTNRELHPAFFAAGAGVPKGPLGEIPQTAIAGFVSQLLGITPPE